MKKSRGGLLLIMLVVMSLMACTKKTDKEIDIENTKVEDQNEMQENKMIEEDVADEAGFVGGIIEASDSDTEILEENTEESSDESEDAIPNENEDAIPKENEDEDSIKEDKEEEDLLEPPAKSSAKLIELK